MLQPANLFVAAAIAVWLPSALHAADQAPQTEKSTTLARVLAAWKAREERIHSFHFTFDCHLFLPEGYVVPDRNLVGGVADTTDKKEKRDLYTIPKSDYWAEGRDRLRDEYFQVRRNGPNEWERVARVCTTADGTLHSRLTVPTDAAESEMMTLWRYVRAKDPKKGQMLSGVDPRQDPRNADLAPFRLTFRASAPNVTWTPDRCRVVSENELVGEVHCIKIQMDDFHYSETCWVDPKREYIVLRWQQRQGEAAPVTLSIQYRTDKQHGWIPWRWERQLPGHTADFEGNAEFVVTSYSLNEKSPDNTFRPVAPSGAHVCDASVDGLIPAVESAPDQTHASPAQPTTPSMETIVAAWSKRQTQTKSLKITLREERLTNWNPAPSTGTRTLSIDGTRFAYVEQNDPEPPSNIRAAEERERAQLRFEKRHPDAGRGGFVTLAQAKMAFDGTDTRIYRAHIAPTRRNTLYINAGFRFAMYPSLIPLVHMYRPLDPNFAALAVTDFRVSPVRGKIGDVVCVIIEMTKGGRTLPLSLWLDPARDYIVLREHAIANGQDATRMDVSYRNDSTFGWIPDAWKYSSVGNAGTSPMIWTGKVIATEINKPIPASEFQIQYPKGTRVTDLRHEPQ